MQATPSVLMFKQYDAPMLKFEGQLTEKSELSDWISSKSLPSLVELDQYASLPHWNCIVAGCMQPWTSLLSFVIPNYCERSTANNPRCCWLHAALKQPAVYMALGRRSTAKHAPFDEY